jgi:hypothetical protein
LKKLYGATDTEALKAAGDAFNDIFTTGTKAANAAEKQLTLGRTIAQLAAIESEATNERLRTHDSILGGIEKEISLRKIARSLEEEIFSSQAKAKGGGFGAEADARRRAIDGMREELKMKKDLLSRSENEGLRLAEAGPNRTSELKGQISKMETELAQLARNKAGADANMAGSVAAQKLFEKGSDDFSNERRNQAAMKISSEAIAEQIRLKEALLESLKKEAETSESGFAKAMSDADARNQRVYDEVKALEQLIDQREKLNFIESHRENSERHQKAVKEREAELQKIADYAMNTQVDPRNLLSSKGRVGLSAAEGKNALGVINLQRQSNTILTKIERNTSKRLSATYG